MSFANKSSVMQSIQNDLGIDVYGMSVTEALEKHICIDCKNPPTLRTSLEDIEYYVTAICGTCWDSMFNKA